MIKELVNMGVIESYLEALHKKIKRLEKENKRLRKMIKASNIPFDLPDDYYESDDYKV